MIHAAARLAELELRARRRFGQNFLVSADAVDRIVRAAGAGPGVRVLEIGPGLGTLTEALRGAGAEVAAVELDRDLAAALAERWPDLRLVQGDALRVDWEAVAPGEGWVVAANLPYNVATPILMRLLADPRFTRLVLMFQREVADRLQARPGDEAYGALSVQVAARATVERVLELGPRAFHPPPKVASAVMRFSPHHPPRTGGATLAEVDRAVRLGFAQRRKTLANALGAGVGVAAAAAALTEAGIDPRARAETVGLDGWCRLAVALRGAYPGPNRAETPSP